MTARRVSSPEVRCPTGIDLSTGGTTRLALDCAVTGSEADQVRLWADGQLLGSQEAARRIGPFNIAGLFASAPRTPWSASFDDFLLLYGLGYRAPPVTTPRRDRAGRLRRLLATRAAGIAGDATWARSATTTNPPDRRDLAGRTPVELARSE